MKEVFDQFIAFVQTVPVFLVYILLGISAFVENLFPPVPGDTVTAFGAFLVATGRLSLVGVYVSTTLGSFTGFMGLFLAGKHLGRPFFLAKDYRFFKAKNIIKAEKWFERYGYLVVASNRFLPGLRSVISVAGGICGMKTPMAALLSLLSCSLWNLIWIWAGYTLGTNWQEIKSTIIEIQMKYNLAALIIIAIIVASLISWKRFSRKG